MQLTELIWTEDNIEHIWRHMVTPDEVEAVIWEDAPWFERRSGVQRYYVYDQCRRVFVYRVGSRIWYSVLRCHGKRDDNPGAQVLPSEDKMKNKLPKMTRKEEAQFWETHDATDYASEFEPVVFTRGVKQPNRCSQCQKLLLSRYIDLEIGKGQVVVRQLRELYCPDSHEKRLAPEAQMLVEALEAVVRLAPQSQLMPA
jgi:hypothetical protein